MAESSALRIAEAAVQEPYCRFLDLQGAEIQPGRVTFHLPYRDAISNPGRQVHGGVVSSALGIAGRVAALSQVDLDASYTASTVELNVVYLSSAVGEDIVAEGVVLRRGKELSHVRCVVANREGKQLATGISIFRTVAGSEAAPAPLARGKDTDDTPPPFASSLGGSNYISAAGIAIKSMKGGRAKLFLPYRDDLSDGQGALHEGVVGALVDTAGAMAAWSNITPKAGMRVSTVSIDVNFCAAVAKQDVLAYSQTVTRRKELFFNRVDVIAADGTPVALGSVIYRIVLPE